MKKALYTLLIGLLFSCQQSEIDSFIEEMKEASSFQSFPKFSNAIQLDYPSVGQKNRYIKWTSENGYIDLPIIEYQIEDTVTLEVVKKIEDYIGDDGTSRGTYAIDATQIYELKENYNKEPDQDVIYWLFTYDSRKVILYAATDLNDPSSSYPRLLAAPHTKWYSSYDGLLEGVVELPTIPANNRVVMNGLIP